VDVKMVYLSYIRPEMGKWIYLSRWKWVLETLY
jgi:hypothetical protein